MMPILARHWTLTGIALLGLAWTACQAPTDSSAPSGSAPGASASATSAEPQISSRVTCDGQAPGTIWTVAGTRDYDTGGPQDEGKGDGGSATRAQLDGPYEVLLDEDLNIFIADDGEHGEDTNPGRIRMVDAQGIISTAVGQPTEGGQAAPGEAGMLNLHVPWGIAFDQGGLLYVVSGTPSSSEVEGTFVYRVDDEGTVEVVVQSPPGVWTDNGTPTELELVTLTDIHIDQAGVLYLSDVDANRIWAVDPAGEVRLFAGTGEPGFSGDGGPAVNAQVEWPGRVISDSDGNVYFTDIANGRVRKVDPSGIITTVAGGGSGESGDGGPATSATLVHPFGLARAEDGTLYVAEVDAHRIRRVDPEGTITTVAGTGEQTGGDVLYGDGGPAIQASFNQPSSVIVGPDGNLYVADWENARVRMICL